MSVWGKFRTGLLTSEPCSLPPTDTDNAHFTIVHTRLPRDTLHIRVRAARSSVRAHRALSRLSRWLPRSPQTPWRGGWPAPTSSRPTGRSRASAPRRLEDVGKRLSPRRCRSDAPARGLHGRAVAAPLAQSLHSTPPAAVSTRCGSRTCGRANVRLAPHEGALRRQPLVRPRGGRALGGARVRPPDRVHER